MVDVHKVYTLQTYCGLLQPMSTVRAVSLRLVSLCIDLRSIDSIRLLRDGPNGTQKSQYLLHYLLKCRIPLASNENTLCEIVLLHYSSKFQSHSTLAGLQNQFVL